MTYEIRPAEMATVFARTGAERDRLREELDRVYPLVHAAGAAAAASAPIAAALDEVVVTHNKQATEITNRVAHALYHGGEAVSAYVFADEEMAAEYARTAAAFGGPRRPGYQEPIGAELYPVPPVVRGE